MKKLLFAPAFVLMWSLSQAQITAPQPSPKGAVSSVVGLTDVEINYFRPKVKGRKIFGSGADYLEQYGKLWRTGANSGSKISFSTDVMIAGQKVSKGEYLILTIPDAQEWEFILYTDPSIGGNMTAYKEENALLKTKVKAQKLSATVETMTFNISDISEDNTQANIHFAWADASFKVPMSVTFDEEVMADIERKTKVNPVSYVQAANYYLASGKDLNQALTWVNTYLAIGENDKQFWNVHLKARILAGLGNKKEAIATAEESMSKAKANPSGDFGYIKRNSDLIASLKGN